MTITNASSVYAGPSDRRHVDQQAHHAAGDGDARCAQPERERVVALHVEAHHPRAEVVVRAGADRLPGARELEEREEQTRCHAAPTAAA